MPSMEVIDHSGIYRFAEELVQGSVDAVRAGHTAVREAFVTAYGEGPDPDQTAVLDSLFPWDGDGRYNIGPYAVKVVIDEDQERMYGLGEFITGVAVACGIHPTPKEIETTIYTIGKLMGKLER